MSDERQAREPAEPLNEVIHKIEPKHQDESDSLSPEDPGLSTGSCGNVSDVGNKDIAAGALEAARAIAGRGGPSGSFGPSGRRRRRRPDGPQYSGARPDDRDPVALGSVVKRALPELGWVAPLAEARLMTQWETVVGADIAARCHPVSLVDGDLKVAAESTAWATQLRLMAPQILAKITADLPRGLVKKVVITGPSGPSWKRGPWSVRGRGVRDTYG